MSTVVITGGAGFVGSHLCDAYLQDGWQVVAIDSLFSGRVSNLDHLASENRFRFIEADIRHNPVFTDPVQLVLHFASPASPVHYLEHPLLTLETAALGTRWALDLARRNGARFLMASTSEIYGDPLQHPQCEKYRGNVNPTGVRSVYDEGKRFAEALTMAYKRQYTVNTGIARLFNTYGPRMRRDDGRVVSNFISQALNGQMISVYGDGRQTRSFCYISDTIDGLKRLAASSCHEPVNIGNPQEYQVLELARLVIELTQSTSTLHFADLPADDPVRRCPDISRAIEWLGWTPTVDLDTGLQLMLKNPPQ